MPAHQRLTQTHVTPIRPPVLCVDDEPHVLEGLRDALRRSFDVHVASSGTAAVEMLRRNPNAFEIIISDMRMPVMSGSVFLGEARRIAPGAVRILLTGHADTKAAIRAVNDGQVFRFLTKPCDRDELLRACAGALTERRVKAAERVLLEQTLRGSIQALTEVLAVANPSIFGQATRVQETVRAVVRQLGLEDGWEIDVAAMLAHVGTVALPTETAMRLQAEGQMTADEKAMVARLPDVTQRILGNIPRLEGVLQIIGNYMRRYDSGEEAGAVPIGARILRVALDLDRLRAAGMPPAVALEMMSGRAGLYDPEILEVCARVVASLTPPETASGIALQDLEPGMILARDLETHAGQTLVPNGCTVTVGLVERLRNFKAGFIREPVHVLSAQPGPVAVVSKAA
jgi:response regulator RpfG family c-di-GMP phosphodiesterase